MMYCDRRVSVDVSSFWRVVDFDCHSGDKNIPGDVGDTTFISDVFSIAFVDNTITLSQMLWRGTPQMVLATQSPP